MEGKVQNEGRKEGEESNSDVRPIHLCQPSSPIHTKLTLPVSGSGALPRSSNCWSSQKRTNPSRRNSCRVTHHIALVFLLLSF